MLVELTKSWKPNYYTINRIFITSTAALNVHYKITQTWKLSNVRQMTNLI